MKRTSAEKVRARHGSVVQDESCVEYFATPRIQRNFSRHTFAEYFKQFPKFINSVSFCRVIARKRTTLEEQWVMANYLLLIVNRVNVLQNVV